MATQRISHRFFVGRSIKALLYSASLLFALSGTAGAASTETAKRAYETKPPVKVVETLVTAWNKNDTETIGRLFLPDAVLIMPNGSVVRSRSQIKKRILNERRGRLKATTLRNTVEDVSLPSSNSAVVKGKYQIEGIKVLGINMSPEGPFTFSQKKRQGRWLISKAEIGNKSQ